MCSLSSRLLILTPYKVAIRIEKGLVRLIHIVYNYHDCYKKSSGTGRMEVLPMIAAMMRL